MGNDLKFGDPQLLFELWRQFTGEDLMPSKTPKKRKDEKDEKKGRQK